MNYQSDNRRHEEDSVKQVQSSAKFWWWWWEEWNAYQKCYYRLYRVKWDHIMLPYKAFLQHIT